MTKEQQDILDILARAERAEARADRYREALIRACEYIEKVHTVMPTSLHKAEAMAECADLARVIEGKDQEALRGYDTYFGDGEGEVHCNCSCDNCETAHKIIAAGVAALNNPATTEALERVRMEAERKESDRWISLLRSIDSERLCDVHDSPGMEDYLRAWLRGVKADALEEWAVAEEILDGEPPEDVIAYFRDKQAAMECLRAAVRSTLKSAKRKAAELRGGE